MCCGLNKKANKRKAVRTTRSFSKKKPTSVCGDMYNELVELSLTVQKLIKLKNDKRALYRDINSQLRLWIRNLQEQCPDDLEYETHKKFIEDERTNNNL